MNCLIFVCLTKTTKQPKPETKTQSLIVFVVVFVSSDCFFDCNYISLHVSPTGRPFVFEVVFVICGGSSRNNNKQRAKRAKSDKFDVS